MESLIHGRTVIAIQATVKQQQSILDGLLFMHALLGCDTRACYFSIGKVRVLKVLREGYSLSLSGEGTTAIPKLKYLPPTIEAFLANF